MSGPLRLSLDPDQLDRQVNQVRAILRLPKLSTVARADLAQLTALLVELRNAARESPPPDRRA